MKRCLTIQDYSCMGRCSLTVALPILSAGGIETVGLPTAVLSNHTAFDKWTYTDLSSEMIKSVDMWFNYNHHFDCIYTGYLGNGQGKIIEEIFKKLKDGNTLVCVDPAYGDNGKLYPGFDIEHVKEMRELLKYADVTCPNLTEAYTLLDKEYKGEDVSIDELKEIIVDLSKLGPKQIVLTGIKLKNNHVGCLIYDASSNKFDIYSTKSLKGRYHGAGDTFTSAMIASMLNGVEFNKSIEIAHDFVHRSMKNNINDNVDGVLYGLEYETNLSYLINRIKKSK